MAVAKLLNFVKPFLYQTAFNLRENYEVINTCRLNQSRMEQILLAIVVVHTVTDNPHQLLLGVY